MQIRHIPFFNRLPHSEQEHLSSILIHTELPADSFLFREGDQGDRLYIIVDGEVEIMKVIASDESQLLDVRGPGDFLGEMSLFERQTRRTATARARTAVILAEMSHADFDALLHRRPALVYELVRIFSERLQRSNNSTIRELRAKNEVLQATLDQLQEAQAQLIEQEKLAHELKMAREIQLSIVPRECPTLVGYDCGALMAPARAVGGDFFDFVQLDENRLGLVIGDVSDKGVPAAIFMALTHSLLRAEARRGGAPAEVLASVNRQLCEMNDQGMFVTVLYGILDSRTGQFTYARAGHELPLLIDHQDRVRRLTLGLGQPLAIFLDSAIDEQSLTLTPGSTLLLYTDGVTEATNAADELFGWDRLVSALQANRHLAAQAMSEQLLQAIRHYEEETTAFDDVTLVALHRRL